MRSLLSAVLIFISLPGWASPWSFGEKLTVAENLDRKVFQHIDATGRKSIAVAGQTLAVIWEDNRSGAPQIYLAFKNLSTQKFSKNRQISTGRSAYAPQILALSDDLFLIGWEQDDAVWLRTASASQLGPAISISEGKAAQVALANVNDRNIVAAWSQQIGEFSQIVTATVKVNAKNRLTRTKKPQPIESKPPTNDQLYPDLIAGANGVTVAWEDRREGHTAILYSHAAIDKSFAVPQALNEIVQKSEKYGRGNGVTRVALAALGADEIGATWMDKRGFQTGYDIYAAFSHDSGVHFGANELVQDAFADQYSQWHPAIAGASNPTRVVVAWDDDRDGSSSIWLAWKSGSDWSENISPPAASDTDKQQTNPAITLDNQGNLHLIWLEQDNENAPTRLMYALGRYSGKSQPASLR
ncbi:MAG: hypothetical protein HY081_10865 [Gammaproteobacteria bacterium]|nr:hypothetical protein [Gammaproteobacteria bacterium]